MPAGGDAPAQLADPAGQLTIPGTEKGRLRHWPVPVASGRTCRAVAPVTALDPGRLNHPERLACLTCKHYVARAIGDARPSLAHIRGVASQPRFGSAE